MKDKKYASKPPNYTALIKGRLFELVLNELIHKSGFVLDDSIDQLNQSKRKIHGRGGVHQLDVVGRFNFGIPFVYPLLLIGEAKCYTRKVRIGEVRQFLGLFIDVTQYHRVETHKDWGRRYQFIFKPKHTYCPAFFSLNGFARSAEAFMFAHGIFPISYQKNYPMERLNKLMNGVLANIRVTKFRVQEFKYLTKYSELPKLPDTLQKKEYLKRLTSLNEYLDKVNSYIGVLDNMYPISILSTKRNIPRHGNVVKLERENEMVIKIKSSGNREYGTFTLSSEFLNGYIKRARTDEKILSKIDLLIHRKGTVSIAQLAISKESRETLLKEKEVQIKPAQSESTNE